MKLPYMPVYIGDFLTDTMDLTPDQMGAYWLLCMAYWQNQGALPSEINYLLRASRMQKRIKSLQGILDRYFEVHGDLLIHHRIEKELNRARTAYAQRAQGARTANGKRGAVRTQPEPEPEPYKKKKEAGRSGAARYGAPSPPASETFQPPPADAEINQWTARCAGFKRNGFWNKDLWGPTPGAKGCKAPADAIRSAGIIITAP